MFLWRCQIQRKSMNAMRSISSKMVDPLTRRQFLIAMLLALSHSADLASAKSSGAANGAEDTAWLASLRQYGWNANHLKNKVEHGDVTTFELGTTNYEILNPEAQPEFITADQPHYKDALKSLTHSKNGTEVLDMSKDLKATKVGEWEKLDSRTFEAMQKKRQEKQSSDQYNESEMQGDEPRGELQREGRRTRRFDEMSDEVINSKRSAKQLQMITGAKPFQKNIMNLS